MNEIEGFQNNVAGEGWPVIFPVCITHNMIYLLATATRAPFLPQRLDKFS